MINLRSVFAALLVVAAGGPAFARATYIGSDWNDVVARVDCKDVKQLPDGQWQFSAYVSIGGEIRSNPIVTGTIADALKKKCAASSQTNMSGAH